MLAAADRLTEQIARYEALKAARQAEAKAAEVAVQARALAVRTAAFVIRSTVETWAAVGGRISFNAATGGALHPRAQLITG